jgi:predicted transcriptional regulator
MRTLNDLRQEIGAVARGERAAPQRDESGVLGVLTAADIELMRPIAARQPASVSTLAELAGRRQSNVSRSLQDLARHGLVRLVREGMAIRPELGATKAEFDLAAGTVAPPAAE